MVHAPATERVPSENGRTTDENAAAEEEEEEEEEDIEVLDILLGVGTLSGEDRGDEALVALASAPVAGARLVLPLVHALA